MTLAQLLVLALTIKNETVENANSSTRIGTLFQEIINYLEGNAIDVSAEISAAVAALVNGSPAQLDTLKELSAALNNDANFASTVINQIASESQARTAADNTLQANITAESQARTAADNTLQTNINTEVGARETADNVILAELAVIVQNLSNIEEALTAAEAALQANITSEAQARTAADSVLQTNINKKQTGGKRTLIKADFNAGLVGYTKLIDELDNSSGIEYEADGYYNLKFQSAYDGYFIFKQLSWGGVGALHVVYDGLLVDQGTKVTFHFEDNEINVVNAPGEFIIDVEFIPL